MLSGQTCRGLLELAKPRITLMAILTAAIGAFAANQEAFLGSLMWLQVCSAVGFLVASANVLNCWLERDVDGLMSRTASRPLPAGRMAPKTALFWGCVTGTIAAILLASLNGLTLLLGLASLCAYVGLYTPMKRRSAHALWVGAVPGAMPPVLGWTAMTGDLGAEPLALFAWMYFWQVPHFIAIALFRGREYERAGLQVLPNVVGEARANFCAAAAALATVAASLWFIDIQLGGPWTLWVAALGGVLLVLGHLGSLVPRWSSALSRPNFFYSLLYLTVVLLALAADQRQTGSSTAVVDDAQTAVSSWPT